MAMNSTALQPVKEIDAGVFLADREKVLSSKVPLVMRGLCAHWPIVKLSSNPNRAIDYLKEHYSRAPVTTCILPPSESGRVFYNPDMSGFNFSANLESFSTFIRFLMAEVGRESPRGVYMPSTDVKKWFPGMEAAHQLGLDDLDPIKLLWMGNRTKVAAHYDFASNVACCVLGRRRFILFPPEQAANLYPGPLAFAPGGQEISLVNFDSPDSERFPRFMAACEAAFCVELSPGDTLFLPGMWWHYVEGLDDINALFTHWWRESPAYLGRPTDALLHAILSLRSLSVEQRSAWRALFDYYVFAFPDEDLANIPKSARRWLDLPISENDAGNLKEFIISKLGK
jgi:hypothetical protein